MIVPENTEEIGRFYVPMKEEMHKVWSGYSEAELRLLLRFAMRATGRCWKRPKS